MLRPSMCLLAVAFVASAIPALAQSEEAVYESIEAIHGDANGFFELFSIVQGAMMFGDPVTIAGYAAYPLTVRANGEVYDVLEEQDLLDNFDALVMPETQAAIANQDVADLVVTGEGVGLGNGVLHITNFCVDDGCSETYWAISAINN